jgi:hypothetical protein
MENPLYLTKMNKKVFQIVNLDTKNEKDDTFYWLAKPAIERFIALEILRQRFYDYDSTTARLQRVYSIAQQA